MVGARFFIDTIHKRSSRFPVWNPSCVVNVGDYGEINKESGEFEVHGNIYTNPVISEQVPILQLPGGQPAVGCTEDRMVVCGDHTTSTTGQVRGWADFGPRAQASLQLEFQTSLDKRGAFLVMTKPQTTYLPGTVPMQELAKVKALRNMQLVTETITCPAYIMCLTAAHESRIKIALVKEIPEPSTMGLAASGHTNVKWWLDNKTALFREGCNLDGLPQFTTLLKLRAMTPSWKDWFFRLTKARRDSALPEPSADAIWTDSVVPWGPLNEDDEEDEMEDTVFDD